MKNWECGKYKLYTTGVVRFNKDISRFYHLRITENFAYKALPCLGAEIHYSFIYSKGLSPKSQFNKRHRLEIETNHELQLNHQIKLKGRNRFQFTKSESEPGIRTTFRHRFMVVIPIEKCGKLTAFQCSDELFYEFSLKKINQNRFKPIELIFALTSKTSLTLFLMMRQSFISSLKQWEHSFVLGSEIGL